VELIKTNRPHWHPIKNLDTLRQFTMCEDTRHVLDNWGMKYLDIRIDMRTGNFAVREGNTDKPQYIKIAKE